MNSYPNYPFPVYPQPIMMPTPFPYFYPWRCCPGTMMPFLPPMPPMNPLNPIEPHPRPIRPVEPYPVPPRPIPPQRPLRPPFESGQSPWIQAYREQAEDGEY